MGQKSSLFRQRKLIIIGIFFLLLVGTILVYSRAQRSVTFKHSDNTVYAFNDDGLLTMKKLGQRDQRLGFALSGDYRGQDYLYTVEDAKWTWEKTPFNYSVPYINESNDDLYYNVTRYGFNFTATSVTNRVTVKQIYSVREYEPIKLTIRIKHSLSESIENTKFWFIYQVYDGMLVKTSRGDFRLNLSNPIHVTDNLEVLLPRIDFPGYGFQFSDIVRDGFIITDLYIGDGGIIGRQGIGVAGIGVTKNSGVFPPNIEVVIDPTSTGNIYPNTYGLIINQWTNSQNALTSDNTRATETTVGHSVDYYNFTHNLPPDATVTGITIYVEACNKKAGCIEE